MDRKRALYLVFLVSLWLPLAAVGLSPRFGDAVRAVVDDPSGWNTQKEVLRRSTPLWDGAVSLYNTLLYRMGSSGNRSIAVVGQDGWVFLGDLFNNNFSQAIGRRTLTPDALADWSAAFRGQEAYLRATGRAYLVVVMPAKWSVYPDKLPSWTAARRKPTSFDALLAVRPSLPLIDLRPSLKAARSTAETYSRLNAHWTEFGAWAAWGSIADEIERRAPGTRVWRGELTGIPVSDARNEFEGLIGIRATNAWTGVTLRRAPTDYEVVQADGSLKVIPWNTHTSLLDLPRTTHNRNAISSKKLLILRDSTGDAPSMLFQSAFRDVVQIGHALDAPAMRPDFISTVEAASPDIVILMLTERYLDTPPPQPLYWRLARAYYAPGSREIAGWSGSDDVAAPLRVSGDASLSRSSLSADFSKIARNRGHSAVVEVRGVAMGAGKLGLGIKCATAPDRSQELDYHVGLNVFFFELRGDDCDGSLVMERREGAAFSVQTLTFRQQ